MSLTTSQKEEAEALRWLDQALESSPETRLAWLVEQNLAPALQARVERLLEIESRLAEDFLKEPARLQELPGFPRVGERLGNYQLLRELDAGGMGVVFLAQRADEAYDQVVAVKLIRPTHLSAAPDVRRRLIARFQTERELLARLDHRNIARILDGGSTASGLPYLVMEYVDGVSILRYCEEKRIEVRGRVGLLRKVCAGVQEAHRNLIVHRDLKPENILVGANGEPRLLDFGIARALQEAPDAQSNETLFTAITPAYASPEHIRREQLTTSSDVYSLGVILYQLLAGVRPYELHNLSPVEAERTVCETQPAPVITALARAPLTDWERRRRRAQIAPDLERIVAKAMHKDAARRYRSAQELGDDLGRFLDGRPVEAHPDSAAYRVGKFVRRHRAGSAAGAIALTAILATAGIALWQANVARRAASDMKQINSFLLDVLSMADPFEAGSELTLSQALDGAAETIDKRFAGRPDLSAEIRFGIGNSMLYRYRLEAAEKQLTRALEEHTAEFGANDLRTLRVIDGLAGLRLEQGRMPQARALYEDAIAKAEAGGHQGDPFYATLLGNFGNWFLVQEDYAQAQEWLMKCLALQPPSPAPSLEHASLLSNLAHAAHGLEQYDEADKRYAQTQQEFGIVFPNGNPDLAIVLNNRALLAEDRGRLQDALALHRESLAVRRKVFGSENQMIVVALGSIARTHLRLGQPKEALPRALEATTMADRVYTEPAARHASVHATLAEARLQTNDEAGAIESWLRAKSLLDRTQDPPASVTKYVEEVRVAICKIAPSLQSDRRDRCLQD